jgi:hypothetical protein
MAFMVFGSVASNKSLRCKSTTRVTAEERRLARALIIGDTHCPGMRAGYIDFLKRVADDYAVTRVVHIGDLVDWASISYHEKSPSLRNATQEYTKARQQVATLARAFPKADWLIGNHDALTERQAVTAGLPPELLRDYADMWEVGWAIRPRFSKLLIDGVIYSHGDRRGRMARHGEVSSSDIRQELSLGEQSGRAGPRRSGRSISTGEGQLPLDGHRPLP